MLSIGPDSSCDICFERFGQDLKAAWSIECGHIFCGECIQNIDDPRLCPMCRSPFEHESCIRLHVDLDLAQGEPSSVDAAALQEARRFKHALASIAETGATEPRLRQLIQDGNSFLNSQPRNSHKDLRNAHRIIAYLYEVKMTSRSQAQVIDTMKEQVTQLRKEKEELEQKLEKQEEIRQYESETAAAVENTLREHCAQAKQAQKAASEQHKKLTEENEDLKKQLKLKSITDTLSAPKSIYGRPDKQDVFPTYKTKPSEFDRLDMKDIAIQDPSSYLISPLPKFSNALPAMFDSFATLPDLAADMDETRSNSTDEESDEEVHTPESPQQQLRPSAAREVRASFAPEPVQPSRAPPRGTLAPSGLSRTAPHREHRRERSCSNPNPSPSASRSHSPFDSIASATPLPAVQITNHSASSSRETYASPLSQEGVNPRLRDILTHNTSSPSSLPIFSANHFPSSLKRDGSAAQRDDRPQAGSSRSSEPLVTPQANGSSSKTPRSTSPNRPVSTRMSSASAEAKKLEDEKRRRYLEEKYGAEGERQPVEPERDPSRWYNVPSNLSNTLNTVIGTSSASQAARSREQQQQQQPPPYANPNPTLASMPTLKRSSTTGANYVNSKASTLLPPASSIPAGTDGIQMGRVQGSKSAPKSLLVNPTTYP